MNIILLFSIVWLYTRTKLTNLSMFSSTTRYRMNYSLRSATSSLFLEDFTRSRRLVHRRWWLEGSHPYRQVWECFWSRCCSIVLFFVWRLKLLSSLHLDSSFLLISSVLWLQACKVFFLRCRSPFVILVFWTDYSVPWFKVVWITHWLDVFWARSIFFVCRFDTLWYEVDRREESCWWCDSKEFTAVFLEYWDLRCLRSCELFSSDDLTLLLTSQPHNLGITDLQAFLSLLFCAFYHTT